LAILSALRGSAHTNKHTDAELGVGAMAGYWAPSEHPFDRVRGLWYHARPMFEWRPHTCRLHRMSYAVWCEQFVRRRQLRTLYYGDSMSAPYANEVLGVWRNQYILQRDTMPTPPWPPRSVLDPDGPLPLEPPRGVCPANKWYKCPLCAEKPWYAQETRTRLFGDVYMRADHVQFGSLADIARENRSFGDALRHRGGLTAAAVHALDVDAIVFNQGAHYVCDADYVRALNTTISWLLRHAADKLIVFRTAPFGHSDAAMAAAKAAGAAFLPPAQPPPMTSVERGFHYDGFEQQNALAVELLARRLPTAYVMDVAAATNRRPDGHRDHVHYKGPGVIDDWARLWYNILIHHFEITTSTEQPHL
jgi:hypothetical protein